MKTLLAMLMLAGAAAAQPASDLLQSGIFSQDTLGDLDAAIRIYRQILNGGAGMRVYAPQAQYRLGSCLLRKGDTLGATRAFQAVISDYPEERELAARAKESLPRSHNTLLPAPWGETEVTEYRWTIPGVDDGWSISRAGRSLRDAKIGHIQSNFYSPELSAAMVEFDSQTMLPIRASYRLPALQNARPPGIAGNVSLGPFKDPPSIAGRPAYALGEVLYVLRRMPLAPGWKDSIPLISPEAKPLHWLIAEVTGTDTVVVPAGSFQCYKVRLSAGSEAPPTRFSSAFVNWLRPAEGETVWYGIDDARPLVKIESGGARGELASLRGAESPGNTSFRDSRAGYSFTLPRGWVYHPRSAITGDGSSVDLLDPESQTVVIVSGRPKRTDAASIAAELQAGVDERIARRDDGTFASVTPGLLGGHQSVTLVKHHAAGTRTTATIWVQSESTRLSIAFSLASTEYEGFLLRLKPILDSLRMP